MTSILHTDPVNAEALRRYVEDQARRGNAVFWMGPPARGAGPAIALHSLQAGDAAHRRQVLAEVREWLNGDCTPSDGQPMPQRLNGTGNGDGSDHGSPECRRGPAGHLGRTGGANAIDRVRGRCDIGETPDAA